MDAAEPPILMTVDVTEVRPEGTETMLFGRDSTGAAVLVAVDARMAAEVAVRLADGERPVPVTVDASQVVAAGTSA
jgi:hypothetical protein